MQSQQCFGMNRLWNCFLRSGDDLLLCAMDCLADKVVALLTSEGAVAVLDECAWASLAAGAVSACLTCKCQDFAFQTIKSSSPHLGKELAVRRMRCGVILTAPLHVRQITDVNHPD